jgi:Trk K+ transport system NAD-binding subunit
MEFLELVIGEKCEAADASLASIASQLPEDCVLVSIQRGHKLLVPHGDTVFQVGDVVNCFVKKKDEAQLKRCLLGEEAVD